MMKNERIRVTSEMRDRFTEERKRHNQKQKDVAEYLNVEPGTYSRYLRGEIDLSPETLRKLCILWGVREDYLLCNDNDRTKEDIINNANDTLNEKERLFYYLLDSFGYDTDFVRFFIVSPAEMANTEYCGLFDFIEPHIHTRRDIWEVFKNTVRDSSDYINHYSSQWFLVDHNFMDRGFSAFASEKMSNDDFNFILNHTHVCVKISKNGKLVGYIKRRNMYDIESILENSLTNLCETLFDRFVCMDNTGMCEREIIGRYRALTDNGSDIGIVDAPAIIDEIKENEQPEHYLEISVRRSKV